MASTRLIRIKRVPGAQCGVVVHDAYFIIGLGLQKGEIVTTIETRAIRVHVVAKLVGRACFTLIYETVDETEIN